MKLDDNSKAPRAHALDAVGDWFAIGSVFSPYQVQYNDKIITGMRSLICIDTGSHYIMSHREIPTNATTLTPKDVLPFLANVMVKIGIPRQGFIFLKSAFASSNDLATDPITKKQGEYLRSIHCAFNEMSSADKAHIAEKIQIANTQCIFKGLARIEAEVTLAFTELLKVKPK